MKRLNARMLGFGAAAFGAGCALLLSSVALGLAVCAGSGFFISVVAFDSIPAIGG